MNFQKRGYRRLVTLKLWAATAMAASLLVGLAASADDWPQWLGPRRDGVWRETGIVKAFPTNGLSIRWRVPVGAGYSGPSVAAGHVYVTDRQFAAKTSNPKDPFQRGIIQGTERVLCLDGSDGKVLWKYEYDCPYDVSSPAGPRASPVIEN